MDAAQWLTALGMVMGAGGIGSVIITQRTTARIEAAKSKAVENQQKLDATKMKLEGWETLVSSLQAELKRKDEIIAAMDDEITERDGRIAELEAKIRGIMRRTTRKKAT